MSSTSTAPVATSVAIIGPNLYDQSKGQFHVHSETCRDGLNPRKYPLAYRWVEQQVSSVWDVLVLVYGDIACDSTEPDSPEWEAYIEQTRSEFHFHGCVSDLR